VLRQPEIQADGLGVADVEVAIRLRGEPGMDAPAMFLTPVVGVDDVLNEMATDRGFATVA